MKLHHYLATLLCVFAINSAHGASTKSHGVSLFGDLKYSKDFKHLDYVNPDAPKGGKVTLGTIGTFDSLNPFILKGVAAQGVDMMFESLVVGTADEAASAYGLIAHTVEVADDRSWTKYYMREEATWHDGTPITAEDVVFSFDVLTTKGHPYYRTYYQDIDRVEAEDTHTVTFYFSNTSNRELPLISGQLPILSKAYYQTHDFETSSLEAPLGSGPYRVASVDAGRSITLKREKDYWAKDLPINVGRYNFDEIHIDYYRDATVAVEAFKAGEYDFRKENIAKTWANAYNMPQIEQGKVIKEVLPDGTPTGMQAFIFNTRKSDFQDPIVREALSLAYDFEWANKNLFFNAYTRNRSFFGNSIYESKGLPSKEEFALLEPFKDTLPERVFVKEFNPSQTDGSGKNRQNLRVANRLLRDAGFELKDMKRINPETNEPVEIEFLIMTGSTFERVIAPYIKNLKTLGVEATIRSVDSSQYIKRREMFDFDMMINWFTQGNAPGNEQLDYWHSSVADVEGSKNLIGIKDPAVDAMIDHIINAQSQEELITATSALDRILQWSFYAIPQWHSRTHRIIYWNKFGRPETTPPYSLGFTDTWWVKE